MEDENKKIFGKVTSLLTRDPKLFIPWSKEVEGIFRTAGEARNADFLSGPTKGIRYAFPPITQQDYLLPPLPGMQWSNEQVSDMYLKVAHQRRKEEKKMEENRPRLWEVIWSSLSQDSKTLVTTDLRYSAARRSDDWHMLYSIIEEKHLITADWSDEAGKMRAARECQQEYNNMRQGPTESLATFKTRFEEMMMLRSVHPSLTPRFLPEEQQAQDYLEKLYSNSSRKTYAQFQLFGVLALPKTLAAMYTLSVKSEAAHKADGETQERGKADKLEGDLKRVLVQVEELKLAASKTAAATAPGMPTTTYTAEEKEAYHQRRKEARARKKLGKAAVDSAASATGARGDARQRTCFRCGEDHLVRDCTKVSDALKAQLPFLNTRKATNLVVQAERAHARTSMETGSIFAIGEFDGSDSEEDDYADMLANDFILMTTARLADDHMVLDVREVSAEGLVLLDSQAAVNVFKDERLLSDVLPARQQLQISGVNKDGESLVCTHDGVFGDFGRIHVNPGAVANILSQACMIDDGHRVEYSSDLDRFTLTPRNGGAAYIFDRKETRRGLKSAHYTCNMPAIAAERTRESIREVDERPTALATVKEQMALYTRIEREGAIRARLFLYRTGFPSKAALIEMAGSMLEVNVTRQDIERAHEIWGEDLASLKGKTTNRTAKAVRLELSEATTQIQQVLEVDIFFIDGSASFLLGYLTPSGYLMVKELPTGRDASELESALAHMIGTAQSRHFEIVAIKSDNEGGIAKLEPDIEALGMTLEPCDPGGHVKGVERKIRQVKERKRAFQHHLPFSLPYILLVWCVFFCVFCINLQVTSANLSGISPMEAFTGVKINAAVHLKTAFGDYVQATVRDPDNSMKTRTIGGIALMTNGKATGGTKVYLLQSKRVVTAKTIKIVPTPDIVIKYLNEQAANDFHRGVIARDPSHEPGQFVDGESDGEDGDEQQADAEEEPSVGTPMPSRMPIAPTRGDNFDPSAVLEVPILPRRAASEAQPRPRVDIPADVSEDIRGGERERGEPSARSASAARTQLPAAARTAAARGSRTQGAGIDSLLSSLGEVGRATNHEEAGVHFTSSSFEKALNAELLHRKDWRDKTFVMTMSVKAALRTYGQAAEESIVKELQQLLDKRVWTPKKLTSMTQAQRRSIIRSSMFLKDKFLSCGAFEKLKARLVAGGNQQDKTLYDDLSSPTVSTSAVMVVAAIAASEGRHVRAIDIGGAYLNAEMDKQGVLVHMRLDKTLTELLVRLDESYLKYVNTDGTMVVELDKALYGCIESALLWYNNLKATLESAGFAANPEDPCVFNKGVGVGQCTIAVHVDDLLLTCADLQILDAVTDAICAKYPNTTVKSGPTLSYLGMTMDWTVPGEVAITQAGFIIDLLGGCGVEGIATTPSTEALFDVRATTMASDEEAEWFHRNVAKILYLAKRTMPECLVTVAFLATRVTKCDVDDLGKLRRLLRYIRSTRDRGIILRPGIRGVTVRNFVDAAYGVHTDGKSHTGSAIVIGDGGPVFVKSAKQKIVTKSSTEAELVAASDSANQAFHTRRFIIEQGHGECGPVTMYQDNLSCMALIAKGKSSSERTRHVSIRYFWLKERTDDGELEVLHLSTEQMYANALTKPLQGKQFIAERKELTNWVD